MSVGIVSRFPHELKAQSRYEMFPPRRTVSYSSAYCEKCLVQLRDGEDELCQNCRHFVCSKNKEGRSNNLFGNYFVSDMLETLESVLNASPTSSTCSAPSFLVCNTCDAEHNNLASAKCLECGEYLCEACAGAHRKFPITKDHLLQPLSSVFEETPSSASPNSTNGFTNQQQSELPTPIGTSRRNSKTSSQSSSSEGTATAAIDYGDCPAHSNESLCFYCHGCSVLLCHSCVQPNGGPHREHNYTYLSERFEQCRPALEELVSKSRVEMHVLQLSVEEMSKMSQNIASRKEAAIAEVRQLFKQHIQHLLQKESELIAHVKNIADMRIESLANQLKMTKGILQSCSENCKDAEDALQEGDKCSIYQERWKLAGKLMENNAVCCNKNPIEDDSFILKTNVPAAQAALQNICLVTTAPYPPLCSAVSEGMLKPKQGRLYSITVCTRDRSGSQCVQGGERLFLQLKTANMTSVPYEIRDNNDGTYLISFRPLVAGEHQLVIAIRGQHIKGSPFNLLVESGSDYSCFGVVTKIFGSEGNEPGQLCRSWGICSDQAGNIIVGDRSNHRIQIFDSNGNIKHCFGTEGSGPGQFNRPAGVAVNPEGNVVVADKDNHRIQVLKYDGTCVLKFGKKGSGDGQMIYPYDVTVYHGDGRMAVTDSGNHRLLVFSSKGSLIGKFGCKGYLCGHFDSPRGIVFNDEGRLIVSDFNVHHILVIHEDGTTARILGSQGSGNGQFMRPQGLAVDQMGNFVVADTRNHRIVILHPNGQVVAKFGSHGSGPGQFDRPTSVAILPHGRIAVLDFGNSRIQIF